MVCNMDRTPNTYKFSILVLMCFIIAMGMIISSLNPVLFKYCAGEPVDVDLDVENNEGRADDNGNTSASTAGAPAPAFIVDIRDEGLDENNDTSYDTLYLGVRLNISISDIYHVYATMSPSQIDAMDYKKVSLEIGKNEVLLSFPGSTIYDSARDGPYTVEVSLYKSNGEDLEIQNHETQAYKFEDFNPTPATELTGEEYITVGSNSIKLETNTFIAVIFELTPIIIFYYKSDDGLTARFKVSYNSVIAFNDLNGDGRFQRDELKYWGNLLESQWNSPKVLMDNFNNFEFQIQTIVDLVDEHGTPIETKLEVVFHYSSLTKAIDVDSARKFDISMKMFGPPIKGISHIALEHTLESELGDHIFKESTTGTAGNKISFLTNDNHNKEHGYYSWKNFVERTSNTGYLSKMNVSYNLEPTEDKDVKLLYLNYPYSMDTSEYFHDPVVGVNPENEPKLPGKLPEEIISHGKWVVIYFGVAIIAGVVILGNIYRQKKKRKY